MGIISMFLERVAIYYMIQEVMWLLFTMYMNL